VGIQSHEDLFVWQLAMQLSVRVHNDVILRLPPSEKYELASQLRRSSTSIPLNIAEGWARPTRVYINHLSIALGSEAELKTQLKVALGKNYVTEDQIGPLLSMASEVGRMMCGLTKSLKRRLRRRP
jgi:four helix bundle protein